MADLPANDVGDDLEIEAWGRPDSTDGAERSTKQHRPLRQTVTAGIAANQVLWRQHLVQRAFLVELPVAAGGDERAENQLVPVILNVFERPEQRRDRLVAHLFRYGDAVGFHFAVGMIRPDADPELAAILQHDVFDFAARRVADSLDLIGNQQPLLACPIENRCRARPFHTERLQFDDMLFERSRITAGPAGDDTRPDRGDNALFRVAAGERKGEGMSRHEFSCGFRWIDCSAEFAGTPQARYH